MNIKNWLISFVLFWGYLIPLYSMDNPNRTLAERLWTLGESYMLEHPEEFFNDEICVHNVTTRGEPRTIDLTTMM